jgi:GNAT superfamily N-acetyltransferase
VIRLLRPSDRHDLLSLVAVAGWNQTAQDWDRFFILEPQGLFGFEAEGHIVASATTIRYGSDLAWIGMVLTHPEYRGQGIARRLLNQAIDYAEDLPCGLDATDMGRPLYASLGFTDLCPIERWIRPAGPVALRGKTSTSKWDTLLDRAVVQHDRTALTSLLGETGASYKGSHALGRNGRIAAYFGPCIASSLESAERIAAQIVAHYQNTPVYWDLFPSNTAATAAANALGFTPQRRLFRMMRNAPGWPQPDPRIYAIAGFEFG